MSERSSESDREVLERVYRRQMEDYAADLDRFTRELELAGKAHDEAGHKREAALLRVARLEGKIAGLRELARRDGIDL